MKEPEGPVILTEIPGPRSQSLLQELNAIQVHMSETVELTIYNYIIYKYTSKATLLLFNSNLYMYIITAINI